MILNVELHIILNIRTLEIGKRSSFFQLLKDIMFKANLV